MNFLLSFFTGMPSFVKTGLLYVIIFVAGFGFGVMYESRSVALDQAHTAQMVANKTVQKQIKVDGIASHVEASVASSDVKRETKYKIINKEVIHYVEKDPSASTPVPSNWLRIVNEAATGTDARDSSTAK